MTNRIAGKSTGQPGTGITIRSHVTSTGSLKPDVTRAISLRPMTDNDLDFLFQLYASTRAEEKTLAGWADEQWKLFVRMQFDLQQTRYRQNCANPTFDIISQDDVLAGRIYVDRRPDEIRIVDISLLPEYRGRGIGTSLIETLRKEAGAENLPVTLHVEKTNLAFNLYQRLGFRIKEDRGVFWFMGTGD